MRKSAIALLGIVLAGVVVAAGFDTTQARQEIDLSVWLHERAAGHERWSGLSKACAASASCRHAPLSVGMPAVWDQPETPPMAVIPPGEFTLGSPSDEAGRFDDEGPRLQVSIGYGFAVSQYPVTRGEYAFFVQDAGYASTTECHGYDGETELRKKPRFTWRSPGFPQSLDDPVVCIAWNDAKAYVDWLSRRTGRTYRLLSEAEWEYSARAGDSGPWRPEERAGETCGGNGADLTAKTRFTDWEVANCRDGAIFTSPVGRYEANAFGLSDMLGNVWEWVEDCRNERYDAAGPRDGRALLTGDCGRRMMRGGSWHSHPRHLRPAARRADGAGIGYAAYGIRVARVL
ncbi:formylglycine-generating enzyme family protein [Azospirillum sp. SYSU D00513]|uniref:formylglycine-generating enzyme family protein n=1 Tax=Azospirillum sp. SYSU D00513 TaxID=2812561 RepID=UPI001A973171|nr:formylglycine-generating enzyme family protein [Azospirillum sp. SYSU D00513]